MDVRVEPVLESRRENGRVCAGEWIVEIEIEAAVDRGVGLAGWLAGWLVRNGRIWSLEVEGGLNWRGC
jgi:hypothetical protein